MAAAICDSCRDIRNNNIGYLWKKGSALKGMSLLPLIQSNFKGSNIFGTIENGSRHGWFEPQRVNYGAKSGSQDPNYPLTKSLDTK